MDTEARFVDFLARTSMIPIEELHAFFDGLEALEPSAMIGDWEGGVFHTGHEGEGQLSSIGWVGKRFHDENDVDPIIRRDETGAREPSPVLGKASLRSVRYRGVVTATMVYDKHPIFDHFRRVSPGVVVGVMDRKGDRFPLFFYLRKLSLA